MGKSIFSYVSRRINSPPGRCVTGTFSSHQSHPCQSRSSWKHCITLALLCSHGVLLSSPMHGVPSILQLGMLMCREHFPLAESSQGYVAAGSEELQLENPFPYLTRCRAPEGQFPLLCGFFFFFHVPKCMQVALNNKRTLVKKHSMQANSTPYLTGRVWASAVVLLRS